MTVNDISSKLDALRGLEASLDEHRRGQTPEAPPRRRYSFGWPVRLLRPLNRLRHSEFARRHHLRQRLSLARPCLRWAGIVLGAMVLVLGIGFGALWWRLSSGPIALDIATPWITAAIEQNFGASHRVEVGGTVLERDEHGRTAMRLRDIVVRDADGKVVASSPRAEVGLSGASLLTGRPRAESLNLVGAEVSIRISPNGQFSLLSADSAPVAADAKVVPATPTAVTEVIATPAKGFLRDAPKNFSAFLAWIDSLSALGLDGYDLNEIGLKNGRVVVDDQRNGQRSIFENITLSITRPHPGEVVFSIGSEQKEKPWLLMAGVRGIGHGRRAVSIEARQIALRDVLLAMRLGDGQLDADVPVSAAVRAEIAPDGMPLTASGRIAVGPGAIRLGGEDDDKLGIERAEFSFDWDAAHRQLSIPLQIVSGGNRFTLAARAEAPREAGGPWPFVVSGGSIVIPPLEGSDGDTITFNRIAFRGRFDPAQQQLVIDQGDVGGSGIGFAASGHLDFSGPVPRLAIGLAAQKMPVSAFKQLWPTMINPGVRQWVIDHFQAGSLDRAEIATNAPVNAMQPGGPPMPDDGLSVEIVGSDAVVTPIAGLPAIRDADLVVRISGRTATIALGRGTVDLPSGRKLTLTDGLFEVPDTYEKTPPARVRMRVDGPVPAAAELLASDRLRDFSGTPMDPATSRGTLTAQVALSFVIDPNAPPGSTDYSITTDLTSFAVDKFVMAQKLEAQSLHIVANNQGYQVKGDVRIGGMPASVEYRKLRDDPDPQLHLQATLDDAARNRLGFDLNGAVSGPIPVKLAGKVASAADQESRFSVDADLTQARVDNLMPGFVKPAGKPVHAAFTYIGKPKSTRLEDIVVEGSGTSVKGTLEIDTNGDVMSANLPTFALSDGDKASIRADRMPDGLLKVVVRGDVVDGRGFIKASMAGPIRDAKGRGIADLDVDARLGAVAGFNGEALRAVELKFTRRNGALRAFSLSSKIGVDTPFSGDLRSAAGAVHRPLLYIETKDAGALFRFTDTYPRMIGGQMWMAMDAPTSGGAPQDGVLNVRNFTIRGEAALDRIVAGGAPGALPDGVAFTRMRVEFSRRPGKLMVTDGVVSGPVVGATIEGTIDYAANDVRMRGTFVPLYGLNNAFGQIPIVGLFLGGDKEGLLGITYEVSGQPGHSILRVNPISAVAPGLFRKFFEFPGGPDAFAPLDMRQ